jgi:hypothetical protein
VNTVFLRRPEMAGTDKAELFSRLRELRSHQGRGWNEIASILEAEGYEEKGEPLTANALRKRFTRWSKTEMPSKAPVRPEPEPAGFRVESEESQRDRYGRQLDESEYGLSGSQIASSLASLVGLNNQLLEQFREFNVRIGRLERDIEERKTSHTEHTDEQPVTTRDLLELLKEVTSRREQQMQFIEENKEYDMSREEVHELIEKSVEDRVDAELKSMLSDEGSFSRQLALLVDERLKTLFSGGEPVPQTAHAGPGRGKRGKTHKKFSASLEEGLFERVKSLPGQFSGHLANALEAYLSVVEEQKPG